MPLDHQPQTGGCVWVSACVHISVCICGGKAIQKSNRTILNIPWDWKSLVGGGGRQARFRKATLSLEEL